jgi:leucyl aminopeptidase
MSGQYAKVYYFLTISRSQVHFIVAACENMISGTGMRPGDIVTASNGKTIEVFSCN